MSVLGNTLLFTCLGLILMAILLNVASGCGTEYGSCIGFEELRMN